VRKSKPALVVLLVYVVLCAGWMLSLDTQKHFTTDVTELLPADERDPEAHLARSLMQERQSRVVLVSLDAPEGTPPAQLNAAGAAHAAVLKKSAAFATAYPMSDGSWKQTLGGLLHAKRFDLLLPGWLAEQRKTYAASDAQSSTPFSDWLAQRAVEALDAHLASPESAATSDLLASDPLLLLVSLANRSGDLTPETASKPNRALIWAETSAGPLTEEGQQPVFAALDEASAAARAIVPGVETRFAGVARFAAAAKASTKTEISRLNIIAFIGVLAVSALFIRRLHSLLHLLPVVVLATLGAVTVTTLIFPRVHVLVFVLGSLLSGVAVDYGFHLVLARRDNESFAARIRRLAVPLLGGMGTTATGFLALVVSELPLVRQLGVYVAAGIILGLGTTLLYFSLLPNLDFGPRRLVGTFALPVSWRLPLLVVALLVAGGGLLRLNWKDDLRSLEYPAPELRTEDARVRAEFGEHNDGATLLTRGDTYAEARTRWQALADASQGKLTGIASLLPSPADYAAATSGETRDQLKAFSSAFRSKGAAAGFEEDAFKPFYDDFAAYLARPAPDYEALMGETVSALPGPLGMLAHAGDDGVWFLSTLPAGTPVPAVAEGTVSLAGIEGLNHLFARYRITAMRLSFVGCAALVIIACCLQGLRAGLRTAALPLLSAALALGLMAWAGDAFGLFHLLGALLGVCLADDYAHFAHSEESGSPFARTAIRLSALTTGASFATLMLSSIPAVAALGTTVSLIVVFALVFVELDLFSLRSHA
jgi:predicted exporter